MAEAPYCKVTFKTCRNPACGRPYVVVAALAGGCKECRRCRRDGYCSIKCRFDARAKTTAISKRS
jgi:hypothetical protein